MSGDPRVEAAARALADANHYYDVTDKERAQAVAVLAAADAVDPYRDPHRVRSSSVAENERLRGRLDATRTALTALEPIAERSCENYTSGPGSCIRAGRKTVSNGPDFTGTADEICYACACWAARRVLEETQPMNEGELHE